jgi:lantibiotic modifying enzyme
MIRDAALAIADRIRSRAIEHDGMLSWTTIATEGSNVHLRIDEGLYGGVAGIALLFLELGDLDTTTRALRWLEQHCDANDPQHYGYYTGRLGVADVFVRAFERTNEQHWLDVALRLARRGAEAEERLHIADLLSGYAGSVLGLIRLHAHAPEDWIADWIERLLARLVDESHRGAHGGIYWDRSPRQIRGLCGLSHGAAGCGVAFLEAGRYFGDPALTSIAEQAFEYERLAFEAFGGDWPDYRIDIDTPEGRARAFAALDNDDRAFFTEPRTMNAWCHGAIGIGLSRLRAGKRNDVTTAIRKTRQSHFAEFMTLCHGSAAAMLFLHRAGDAEGARAIAQPIIEKALRGDEFRSGHRQYAGEDNSLMMGSAGIAYALLMLERDEETVLLPVTNAQAPAARTFAARTLPAAIHPLEHSIDSNARLGLLEVRRRERSRELLARPVAESRLRVVPESAVEDRRIVVAGAHEVRIVELATLASFLVERFGDGAGAGDVIAEVTADYAERADEVRATLEAQIRELVAGGILIGA